MDVASFAKARSARFRTVAAATVIAAGALFGAPGGAQAGVIQLGFMIDASGSLGASGWDAIRTGLATAIGTLVPQNGSYEVTVVKFDTDAHTVVAPTVITGATIGSVTGAILAASGAFGLTNMPDAFELMTSLLTGSANFADAEASYVNLATDGQPNLPGITLSQAATLTTAARNAMIAAEIDNISVEGIGPAVAPAFLQSLCYPGPCDAIAPYSFPDNGFYIGVDSTDDFGTAITQKILVVTEQVPEPASIAIMGFALAAMGAGALRRRRAA